MIAFQGSYVALHLARRIVTSSGERLRLLITGSTLAMALAIWSMHFIGMLSLRFPVAAHFLVLPTLVSFLICILAVGFAISVASKNPLTLARLALASVLMGVGIGSMNYVGLLALHTGTQMTYEAAFVAAGVAIGIAVSFAALWLGFGPNPAANFRGAVFPAAVLMALAVLAVHFTVIAGLGVSGEYGSSPTSAPALSQELLAIIVAVMSFAVSAMFLLILVPETINDRGCEPLGVTSRAAVPVPQPEQERTEAGEPAAPFFDVSVPVATGDGRRRALPADQIVAIHAQAHYSVIFDGEAELFCPLSITEVESMLDPSVFARVHRSHIVNLDRIAFVARGGEAAVAETLTAVSHKVPVSRSRRAWLKKLLQERQSAADSKEPLH